MQERNVSTPSETPKYNPDPVGSYAQAAQNTRVSNTEVGLKSIIRGAILPEVLAEEGMNALLGTPENNSFKNTYEMLKPINADSVTQQGIEFAGNLLGQALTPGISALGKLGAEVSGIGAAAIGWEFRKRGINIAEQMIGKKTAGEFGRQSLIFGGGFAGFSAPEAFEESYNPETGKFNYNKALISTGMNGAMGASIPTAQFLFGLMFGRYSTKVLEEAVTPSAETKAPTTPPTEFKTEMRTNAQEVKSKKLADIALQKDEITPEQHKWLHDNIHDLDSRQAREEATKLLGKEGYETDDMAHTVALQLWRESANTNLNGVTPEQLFSETGDKTALSNFIVHGEFDAMRENPEVANGIDGWVKYHDDKITLEADNEYLRQLEEDALATEPSHTFSQEDLHEKIREQNAHPKEMQFTIPDEALAKLRGRGELLKPKEELQSIIGKLIKKGALISNFKTNKNYHRLEELAIYWPQARKLLDRINLENARHAQMSYRNVLDIYSKLIKAPLGRLANHDNVTQYLKDRIDSAEQKASLSRGIRLPEKIERLLPDYLKHTPEEIGAKEEAQPKAGEKPKKPVYPEMLPEEKQNAEAIETQEVHEEAKEANPNRERPEEAGEAETILDSLRQEVADSKGDEGKDAFKQADRRLGQFRRSQGVLRNLISCVLGTTNGKV